MQMRDTLHGATSGRFTRHVRRGVACHGRVEGVARMAMGALRTVARDKSKLPLESGVTLSSTRHERAVSGCSPSRCQGAPGAVSWCARRQASVKPASAGAPPLGGTWPARTPLALGRSHWLDSANRCRTHGGIPWMPCGCPHQWDERSSRRVRRKAEEIRSALFKIHVKHTQYGTRPGVGQCANG